MYLLALSQIREKLTFLGNQILEAEWLPGHVQEGHSRVYHGPKPQGFGVKVPAAWAKDEYDVLGRRSPCLTYLGIQHEKAARNRENQYLIGTASVFSRLVQPYVLCCRDTAKLTVVSRQPSPIGSHKTASLMSLWVSTLDPWCAERNGRLSQPFNTVN